MTAVATTSQQHPGARATRVVSSLTGWLGSFPAILGSVLVVLLWASHLLFIRGGFLNTNYSKETRVPLDITNYVRPLRRRGPRANAGSRTPDGGLR